MFKLFSSQKREFARQIEQATSIDQIVSILQKADHFYAKHRIVPLSKLFNPKDADDGLFKSKLSSLQNTAVECAKYLILSQNNLSDPANQIVEMREQLDSAVSQIESDLWSDNALVSSLATSAIENTHTQLNEFCKSASAWSSLIYRIAPELSQIYNPHSDDQISKDAFWDMFEFMNRAGREKIKDNFENLSAILTTSIEKIDSYAEQTVRTAHPVSADILFGTVIKEQPPVASGMKQGPLIS